jgi:Zn-dependent oligopeptidase
VGRGENAGETDNRAIAQRILSLRNEQARLHGQASFADYQLLDTMAGSKGAVQGLLQRVWDAALSATERERDAVRAAALAHGATHALEAWDWRFYAEKVRQARYALDEAELKPYFPLEAMVAAMFDCAAQRLFGLRFERRPEWPVYHPDVQAYEVFDADGSHRAVFLHDNFARLGKRSGAWMNALRQWHRLEGGRQTPVILNNNNFAKGAPDSPTLLSPDDVRTLFHEFGHGLHGMLSDALRAAVGHPGAARFRRTALAADGALDRRSGRDAAPLPPLAERRADSRGLDRPHPCRRAVQPGLRDGALHRLGAGRPDHPLAGGGRGAGHQRLRAQTPWRAWGRRPTAA